MSEVQAADSVIREAGTADVINADPRAEHGKSTSDSSTPIAPQSTVKRGDNPDEDRDLRSEEGRSF